MKKYLALGLCLLFAFSVCLTAVAEEPVVLHLVDINYENEATANMIHVFEEAHPGVKVEINHATNGSEEIVNALIASGQAPDVFETTPELYKQYGEYFYDWREDADVLSCWSEDVIDAVTLEDGTIYGLPTNSCKIGLIYNKDLLAAAGYEEIPLTMSGFEEMCDVIYEKTGTVPFAFAAAETWILSQMMDAYINTHEIPGRIGAEKFTSGEMKVSECSGVFSNFFRMMDIALKYTDGEKLLEYDWEYTCNLMANDKIAIISYGDWCGPVMLGYKADINLGMASYPTCEDEAKAVTPVSIEHTVFVFKDSKYFDLAKELAAFISATPEAAQFRAQYGVVSNNNYIGEVDQSVFNCVNIASAALESTGRCIDRTQSYCPPNFTKDAGEAIQGYLIGLYSEQEATDMVDAAWNQN